jgi:hypothetical protein
MLAATKAQLPLALNLATTMKLHELAEYRHGSMNSTSPSVAASDSVSQLRYPGSAQPFNDVQMMSWWSHDHLQAAAW